MPRIENLKRKSSQPGPSTSQAKRSREDEDDSMVMPAIQETVAGKVRKIYMRNFMCHESMEISLNDRVNFIVGRNGSGKSAILTALTVGLGAKATTTNRGANMKEFIKKGKTTANIDITLSNVGVNAYYPDVYGDTITVCKTIGTGSSYRIKNSQGKTITTKKSDLENILCQLNIQVDNPICILNQDVSRTFLIVSDAAKKYQLFLKATQLDVILQKYKDSQADTDDSEKRLKDANDYLSVTDKEIKIIEKSIETLESVEPARVEYYQLTIEKEWAKVVTEEKALKKIQDNLQAAKRNVEDLVAVEETKDTNEKQYDVEIKECEQKIAEETSKHAEKKSANESLNAELSAAKHRANEKQKDFNNLQHEITRKKRDLIQLQAAVKKMEGDSSQAAALRIEKQENLAKFKKAHDDLDAVIQTKDVEKKHLENDRMCVEQEKNALRMALDEKRSQYSRINQQLLSIQQQSDNAISVYGSNMPRLLKRIDDEYARGNFKQKPRGPLGAYVKLKDKRWIPAVEHFLGGLLKSFCTDNAEDTVVLRDIMKEVFTRDRPPQIISSKFFDRMHDTRTKGCHSSEYLSILDAMEISDPVVGNCLIDQREIECVLLIPTNEEAWAVMSNANRVPRNCKRAITLEADLYYPDPNYRTYGGKRGLRAAFLQVSTDQVIQNLKEELKNAQNMKEKAEQQYNSLMERIRVEDAEYQKLSRLLRESRDKQRKLKDDMEKLEDEINSNAFTDTCTVLKNEARDLEDALKIEEEKCANLAKELEVVKAELSTKKAACTKSREEFQNFDNIILPYKTKIRELEDKIDAIKCNSKKVSDKMRKAQGEVQKFEASEEIQNRLVSKLIADAEKKGPRVDTDKTVREIESKLAQLKHQIVQTEKKLGSKEDLLNKLEELKLKYNQVYENVHRLNENIAKQKHRLKIRKKNFITLRAHIGQKIQTSFQQILNFRKYQGEIHIDHKQQTLELEVSPANDSQRKTNDAKTLSGGERSYSTVAFILALWDCTGLPFYFLDEFDVFMDKVNRRVIMDILLEHTKRCSNRQFGFLTPLDTSHIKADNTISIHELAPPEREGDDPNN